MLSHSISGSTYSSRVSVLLIKGKTFVHMKTDRSAVFNQRSMSAVTMSIVGGCQPALYIPVLITRFG